MPFSDRPCPSLTARALLWPPAPQCDVLVPKGETLNEGFQAGKVPMAKPKAAGPRFHMNAGQVTDIDEKRSKSNVGLVDEESGDVCIASLGCATRRLRP